MHDVPQWPVDVTVAEPETVVNVGGSDRKVISCSLTKSMGDTLSGGSGLIATTGDVTIDESVGPVSQRRVTPWSSAAPRRGQSVNIEAGYKDARAQYFTGVVDGTSGGAQKDTRLEIVDRYAALNTEITLDPLLAHMPPWAGTAIGDGGPYRRVGVTPTYVTSTLLRHCGFYATPPLRDSSILSVPMNGSMWAEHGRTLTCARISDTSQIPVFESAQWGQAIKDVTASYSPTSIVIDGRALEIQLLVGEAGTSQNNEVDVLWGNDYVRVLVTSSRAVYFAYRFGSSSATVTTLAGWQMDGATHVVARVTPGGTWTLTADNGQSSSGTRSFPKTVSPDTIEVRVRAGGTQLAGLLVGYHASAAPSFVPSAVITQAAFPHSLAAMPSIVRRRVADVLKEQAEAEMAAFWIDDYGVLQWRNRFRLLGGSPVREITSTKDLLDLNWREPSATTTRSIKVKGKRALTSIARMSTVTVYEGGRRTVEPGETINEFYGPETDEDWVNVDTSVEWVDANAERIGGFHRGRRSWMGATIVTDHGDERSEQLMSGSDFILEKIDPRTFVLNYHVPNISGDPIVELRTSNDGPSWLWPQWRGVELPIIRAYGRAQWVDNEVVRPGESGGMQEHVHDTGWWIQHPTGLSGVADELEKRLLNPYPVLDDVPIIPDARLELGDIVTLRDSHVSGLNLRCLIEGIKFDASEGQQDMSLTLRIITVNGVEATYEELERVWASSTYTGFESEWSNDTYNTLETHPTRRS